MLYDLCLWFIVFLSYSIFGWFTEIIACSITEKKFIRDRGFLLGPYCPIWGMGALFCLLLLDQYRGDYASIFVFAFVGSAILEYLTSFWMEKLFKARWWDYSDYMFNLNGRVCLQNCLGFGALAVIFVELVNPKFISFLEGINKNTFIIISIILFIGFLVDIIVSFTIMSKIKSNLNLNKGDNTYDVDRQVKSILSDYRGFTRHLFNAFPKVEFNLPNAQNIVDILKVGIEDVEEALNIKKIKTEKKLKKKLDRMNKKKNKRK